MKKLVLLAVIVGFFTGISIAAADWQAVEPGYSNCITKAENEYAWASQSIASIQAEIDRAVARISQLNSDIPKIVSLRDSSAEALRREDHEYQKTQADYLSIKSSYDKATDSYNSNKSLREFIESSLPKIVSDFRAAILMSVDVVSQQLQDAEDELANASTETEKLRIQERIKILRIGSEFRNSWNTQEEAFEYLNNLLANKVDPKSEKSFSSTMISFLLVLQKLNNDFEKALKDSQNAEARAKELLDKLTDTLSKLKQAVESRRASVNTAQSTLNKYKSQVERLSNELSDLHARYNKLNGDIQNYQILKNARQTDLDHGCWDRNKVFVREPPPERGGGRGGKAIARVR